MQHQRRGRITSVKLFPQTADEDHRKFQTFAGMHGHDADFISAGGSTLGKAEVHITLPEFLDITDEMKQPTVACSLIRDRLVRKKIQIRSLLQASRGGRQSIRITGLIIDLPQEDMDRRILHAAAK